MPDSLSIKHSQSRVSNSAEPRLSVLIPYFKDDPCDLIASLIPQVTENHDVEICLYDDGSGDLSLDRRVSVVVETAPGIVRLMCASENRGRSFARNTLKANARADWVLFLDADMRPVTDHFITDYLEAIGSGTADIIFGGFEVPKDVSDPRQELHRAFSETSDCLTLEDRQARGPQYVCSSNLCVRKSVLDAEPFDPEFSGTPIKASPQFAEPYL